jgi:hypothetical protein
MFETPDSTVGDLGLLRAGSNSSSEGGFSARTNLEVVQRALVPILGAEAAAEEQIRFLAANILEVGTQQAELVKKTQHALIHPSIRQLIGFSGGTPITTVPRWLVFPILRLAKVMATGVICQAVGASAARLLWGSERLATAAFSAAAGREWVDDAASYTLAGRFNSDLGAIVRGDPVLLSKIIEFRASHDGDEFRKEIAERLHKDEGAQVAVAVNAGLRQALPSSVLEKARNQFAGLFTHVKETNKILPAFWGDLQNSEARLAAWRNRSRRILDEICAVQKLTPYSQCPCGSGEKLKFCCAAALGR